MSFCLCLSVFLSFSLSFCLFVCCLMDCLPVSPNVFHLSKAFPKGDVSVRWSVGLSVSPSVQNPIIRSIFVCRSVFHSVKSSGWDVPKNVPPSHTNLSLFQKKDTGMFLGHPIFERKHIRSEAVFICLSICRSVCHSVKSSGFIGCPKKCNTVP